jgi:acyl carrier protein
MDIEKYNKVFIETFNLVPNKLNIDLKYNKIPEWDSIGHMMLMSALEEEFKITLETNDIIDFSSYEKGKKIIEKFVK